MSARPGFVLVLGPFLASLTILGCSNEIGPEQFATARVRGSVAIGTRPLTGGFVAFDPIETPSPTTVDRHSVRSPRAGPPFAKTSLMNMTP